MTPIKLADELTTIFENIEWEDLYATEFGVEEYINSMTNNAAKKCASICVNKLMETHKEYLVSLSVTSNMSLVVKNLVEWKKVDKLLKK